MEILIAAFAGILLDLLLGDPEGLPHPVVGMGRTISFLENRLRSVFPSTPKGELRAGLCLVCAMTAGTLALSCGVLFLCGRIHPVLRFSVEVLGSWQVLALKDLRKESMNVYRELRGESLENARFAVSRIVGRDTGELSAEGVTKAAVETVAENFSDGVVAPFFWLMIGGVPLALCYKAVNTMDSMVGYKNERFLFFGRCAAKLDDAANYVPSRLSALLLIAAAPLCGCSGKNALRIWRRDRRRHASPNSAQTEAAAAGALGVQLAGPAFYFGRYCEKPTIGDPLREIEPEDIRRANRLNYCAALLGFLLLGGTRAAIFMLMR